MARYKTYMLTQGQRERSQDRVGVFEHNNGVVLVVADGAGGTARGGEAAQVVLDAVQAKPSQRLPNAKEWAGVPGCQGLLSQKP